MTPREFGEYAKYIYELCGVNLTEQKKVMLVSRLTKRLRALNISSFSDYLRLVKDPILGKEERVEMINAVTTNKTEFFREARHFELLVKDVLPVMVREKRKLKVWSAACSTGEEVYSLAMVLDDYFSGHENFAILGSDISTQVLEIAELGIYPGSATSGVPDRFKRKYLMRGKGKWAGKVRVVPELRAKVRFRKINLIEKIPIKTRLDIVFCRNVIIYFDKPTQKDLFERIWRLLSPGGYLFIGHSETLSGISNRFEQVSVSVYRRPEEDKGL